MLRPIIASTVLGALIGAVLAAGVLFAGAADSSNTVSIDNFTFTPKTLTVKAGTTVSWTNHDDIPHGIASSENAFKKSAAFDPTTAIPSPLLHRGLINTSVTYTPIWWARSSWKQQRAATVRSDATVGYSNMDQCSIVDESCSAAPRHAPDFIHGGFSIRPQTLGRVARLCRKRPSSGTFLLQCISLLVAQSGHDEVAHRCPLSGVKRTSRRLTSTSA